MEPLKCVFLLKKCSLFYAKKIKNRYTKKFLKKNNKKPINPNQEILLLTFWYKSLQNFFYPK